MKQKLTWIGSLVALTLLSGCQYYGPPEPGSPPMDIPPGSIRAQTSGNSAISPSLGGYQIPPNNTIPPDRNYSY